MALKIGRFSLLLSFSPLDQGDPFRICRKRFTDLFEFVENVLQILVAESFMDLTAKVS